MTFPIPVLLQQTLSNGLKSKVMLISVKGGQGKCCTYSNKKCNSVTFYAEIGPTRKQLLITSMECYGLKCILKVIKKSFALMYHRRWHYLNLYQNISGFFRHGLCNSAVSTNKTTMRNKDQGSYLVWHLSYIVKQWLHCSIVVLFVKHV